MLIAVQADEEQATTAEPIMQRVEDARVEDRRI